MANLCPSSGSHSQTGQQEPGGSSSSAAQAGDCRRGGWRGLSRSPSLDQPSHCLTGSHTSRGISVQRVKRLVQHHEAQTSPKPGEEKTPPLDKETCPGS